MDFGSGCRSDFKVNNQFTMVLNREEKGLIRKESATNFKAKDINETEYFLISSVILIILVYLHESYCASARH